jgi:hypothetical protein
MYFLILALVQLHFGELLQKLFNCFVKHFNLGIALRMCWRRFGVTDIQ